MGTEATLLKEFVGFLPLFLLHISIGMTASFTTILIHYFEHTQPHLKEYSTLIGEKTGVRHFYSENIGSRLLSVDSD